MMEQRASGGPEMYSQDNEEDIEARLKQLNDKIKDENTSNHYID
jgi:hypothetical protein